MRAAILLALFACPLAVSPARAEEPQFVISLEPVEVVQGGILQIKASGKNIAGARAILPDRDLIFVRGPDRVYSALWGIDLEQRPQVLDLVVEVKNLREEKWIRRLTAYIKGKTFPSETIAVPPAMDKFDAATLKRIEKEQALLDGLWKIRSPDRLWEGDFTPPVPVSITSHFGFRRVINGIARAPHTGVDLKAALGAEVVATNSGRVVFEDNLFFSGNSLVLDHGGGLYTLYFHLSEFRAEKNSLVRKGQVIGLAGMTGRVTGPHLHWAGRLNGARIDPMELLGIQEGARREATGESEKK
jgi:murein DD-endopeptidase MepM/ murein hydrolase activator NlpD